MRNNLGIGRVLGSDIVAMVVKVGKTMFEQSLQLIRFRVGTGATGRGVSGRLEVCHRSYSRVVFIHVGPSDSSFAPIRQARWTEEVLR